VFFSSRIGGLKGGLLATLLSAALVSIFFIMPQKGAFFDSPISIISVIIFLGMGALFSLSHERLRLARLQAEASLGAATEANERLAEANLHVTQLLEQSRELDKIKSQFFANVSHELRTPLTLIMGPVARRLENAALGDDERREMEIIDRNARLLYRHVTDLLDVSRLWREIVLEVAKDYPDVELSHMYVDNAAMQLVRDPSQFDVIVTENLFGDILSDEASVITGSIGMLPSASVGEKNPGLFEPIHGSAPDIAGQDKANPLATILSVAMLLRYSSDAMGEQASSIEAAVQKTLQQGFRTGDIREDGCTLVGCVAMGDAVLANM